MGRTLMLHEEKYVDVLLYITFPLLHLRHYFIKQVYGPVDISLVHYTLRTSSNTVCDNMTFVANGIGKLHINAPYNDITLNLLYTILI